MSSPVIKSSQTEDTGKLKSMVVILREENQVSSHRNTTEEAYDMFSTVEYAFILSTSVDCGAHSVRSSSHKHFSFSYHSTCDRRLHPELCMLQMQSYRHEVVYHHLRCQVHSSYSVILHLANSCYCPVTLV